MTEKPTLAHGDEYVVLYRGGPNDGQTDHRISTDGNWDDEVTVIVSEGGQESMLNYRAEEWRSVGDRVHVTYVFDEAGSEDVDDLEERGD